MIDEHLITTDHVGSTHSGTHFSDKSTISNLGLRNPQISKITIWQYRNNHDFIGCLKVDYNNQDNGIEHGAGKGGTKTEITLAPGEYIVTLEGDFSGGALSKFKLSTNKGHVYGPIGGYSNGGSAFNWSSSSFTVGSEIKKTLGLHYFTGTCDTEYIRSLQAVFSQSLRKERSPAVKYERQAPSDPGASENTALLSEFTRNIMSPIATLLVGPKPDVFHVYERIVCRLPFFTAALNGQFREASHKRILMPEDDPSSIAALVEFLYTGHYTYPHISEDKSSSPDVSEDESFSSDVPLVDSAEGIFHIGVYVVASKYDCQELSKAAIVSVANVLDGLKGIESVRLWKEAYQSGLNLGHVKDFPELNSKMVGMLKEVYAEHQEEMAMTVKDIPELGNDLLKLMVEHATF
ncbi:hypothetical protein P167DRAFT_609774 [Morchella conica CCBAS932]|uniref:BTB domain-containing protein n=1 Tax=Morchella conica CCBAS932 TaxID=1392247 RepID=A0A3N4KC98_9PEZI|nr:hypothetical protein P167DRAFT_609774 [Morchella conica CCBAS932]